MINQRSIRKKIFVSAVILCAALISGFTVDIPASDVINAGIYTGSGVGEFPGKESEYAGVLKDIIESIAPNISTPLITPDQIRKGILNELDVIIFPGGSGRGQYISLGEDGRNAVKEFVAGGGGYLGICAGAFLAQTYQKKGDTGSLKLIKATVYNKSRNWARGAGIIKVKPTAAGVKLIPELRTRRRYFMHYHNGPVLVPLTKKKSDRYIDLITFVSDVHHALPKRKGRKETPGKSLLLLGRNGSGRIVLMAAHPEATPGFRWLLPRMVEIAAKMPPGKYDGRYIHLRKYNREIMFTQKWHSIETEYLAQLSDEDSSIKINAINSLKNMGSRKLSTKFAELLNDIDPSVRIEAAKVIVFYDHFPSKRNLESALKNEDDPEVISELTTALNYLSVKSEPVKVKKYPAKKNPLRDDR